MDEPLVWNCSKKSYWAVLSRGTVFMLWDVALFLIAFVWGDTLFLSFFSPADFIVSRGYNPKPDRFNFWLTDTRGLDLMRLSMRFSFMQELCITLAKWSCAGWVTSVLMPCGKCMHVDKLHPFEQSTRELWAATPFRVRKFNFASNLITSFFCFRMFM